MVMVALVVMVALEVTEEVPMIILMMALLLEELEAMVARLLAEQEAAGQMEVSRTD